MQQLLLFFHLAAAIFWMGGMAFMVLAVRPVLANQLSPPQRLPVIAAVLKRFLTVVAASVAVLLATGIPMLLQSNVARLPPGWHAMLGLAGQGQPGPGLAGDRGRDALALRVSFTIGT